MDNGLRVQVSNGLANLIDSCCGFCIACRSHSFLNGFTQVAVQRALHDDVEVKEVIEEAIDFDDIWMIYRLLDLQFSDKLLNHIALPNLSLCDDLNSKDHFGLPLNC
jgi:hypothetical protein